METELAGEIFRYGGAKEAASPTPSDERRSPDDDWGTTSFFGGSVHMVSRGDGWSVWTPNEPPFPTKHPLGDVCTTGQLRVSVGALADDNRTISSHSRRSRRPVKKVVQDLCLGKLDYVSDYIRDKGAWRDCKSYVRLWQGLDGEYSFDPSLTFTEKRHHFVRFLPLPSRSDPRGALLEVLMHAYAYECSCI